MKLRRPHWTYHETLSRMQDVIDHHPGVVTKKTYGESVQGEPLSCLTVHHPGATEPGVLAIANLHAMEHVGTVTAVTLLARAAAGEGDWTRRVLHVVPMANPDGYRAVEQALGAGRRPFVRKNARGVDLNRNFAVHWDDRYYLNRLLSRIYSPGLEPLSEPETRALDQLGAELRPDFFVSLHAFGGWIFHPWAGRRDRPPHAEALERVAHQMADGQLRRYRVRQLGRVTRLFAACGAEIDHFYQRFGALSFLIEIGSGPGLTRPSTWFHPYRWFNAPADRLEADVQNVLPALDVLATANRS